MVKDGEDWHGLQTTKFEKFSYTFQTVQPWLSPFKVWQFFFGLTVCFVYDRGTNTVSERMMEF